MHRKVIGAFVERRTYTCVEWSSNPASCTLGASKLDFIVGHVRQHTHHETNRRLDSNRCLIFECRRVTIDERIKGVQKDAFLAIEAHRTRGDAFDWLCSTVCALVKATGRRRGERYIGVLRSRVLWR